MDVQLPRLLGTQAFLPAVLAHIRNAASPTSLPLDQVIFQSILLCLIAQDKHLIIRTPEEDLGLAVQLVVWTLSSVFNFTTHKVRIRHVKKSSVPPARCGTPSSNRQINKNMTNFPDSPQVVDSFLRSLFLPSNPGPPSSSNSNVISQDEELTDWHTRSQSGHGHGNNSWKQRARNSRPKSFPNGLVIQPLNRADGASTTGLLMQGVPQHDPINTTSTSSSTLSILKPQPVYAFPQPSHGRSLSPRLSHANTDPLPISPRRRKMCSRSRILNSEDLQGTKNLPQALVISGLENANTGVQRAFSNVLGEKRVVLADISSEGDLKEGSKGNEEVWTFPAGFICVYVCPWNAKERPDVHKTLLDKFAMSTNLFIPQNIRQDFRVLSFAMSTAASARPLHSNISYSNPGSPSTSFSLPLPPSHSPPVNTKALPDHSHGLHSHHPHSHQYQHQRSSTQYSATPPSVTQSLPHAPQSHTSMSKQPRPHTPFRLPPLLPDGFLGPLLEVYRQTRVAQNLDLYLCDLMSAARHESRLDGTLLTTKSMKDARDLVKALRVVGTDLTGMELVRPELAREEGEEEQQSGNEDEEDFHSTRSTPEAAEAKMDQTSMRILEVSEVDIARIFPRVVSHRVRLRDGPEDEVLSSALYGATFNPPSALTLDKTECEKPLDSVKSVLVGILSEV